MTTTSPVGARTLLLAVLLVEAVASVLLGVSGSMRKGETRAALEQNRTLVEQLQLSDLALWSEASYCRHPSQADFFSPYAHHPAALEHLPAGSVVPPPHRQSVTVGGEQRAMQGAP